MNEDEHMVIDYKPLIGCIEKTLAPKFRTIEKLMEMSENTTMCNRKVAMYYIDNYLSKYPVEELKVRKGLSKNTKAYLRYAIANVNRYKETLKKEVEKNLNSIGADEYIKIISKCVPDFSLDNLLPYLKFVNIPNFVDRAIAIEMVFHFHTRGLKQDDREASLRDIIRRSLAGGDFPRVNVRNIKKYVVETENALFNKTSFEVSEGLEEGVDYIDVPWSCVTFEDGYLFLSNPYNSKARKVRCNIPESKKSLNLISAFIAQKLPSIPVKIQDGEMCKVIDKPLLSDCVISASRLPKETIKRATAVTKKQEARLSVGASQNEIEHYLRKKNSEYLTFLCDNQKASKIFSCLEKQVTYSSDSDSIEEAFIFTLNKGATITTVVYENILPSRCSIVFEVYTKYANKAINAICEYFTSNERNKRERLLGGGIKFDDTCIKTYRRVNHTDFWSWRYEMNSYIPRKSTYDSLAEW